MEEEKQTSDTQPSILVEMTAGIIEKLTLTYANGQQDMFILDKSKDCYTAANRFSYQGLKFDHEQLKKIVDEVLDENPEKFVIGVIGTDYNNAHVDKLISDIELSDYVNINSMKLNMNSVEYYFGEKRARTDLPVAQDVIVVMDHGSVQEINIYEPNKFDDKVDYTTKYVKNKDGDFDVYVEHRDKDNVTGVNKIEYTVSVEGMENQIFHHHGVSPHSLHKIYLTGSYIDDSVIDKNITCMEFNELLDLNVLMKRMKDGGISFASEAGDEIAANKSQPEVPAKKKANTKTL